MTGAGATDPPAAVAGCPVVGVVVVVVVVLVATTMVV